MAHDLIRTIANDLQTLLPDCRDEIERMVLQWRLRWGGTRQYIAKKEAVRKPSERPRRAATPTTATVATDAVAPAYSADALTHAMGYR